MPFLCIRCSPPPGEDVLEFCDGNQSLQRLIANVSDFGDVKQSPWILNHPNTLVGSMKVFVRWTYQVEKNGNRESKVRLLEGMEYMRLLGWADSDWKPFRWKQVWEDVFHHTQGLANMVGNAFLASSMPLTTWPSWPHGVAMANMLAIRVCHLSAPALRRGLSKADLSQMRQAPATHLGAPEGAWLNCSLAGRGLMRRLKPLSGLRAAAEPEASLRAEG